MSQIAFNLVLDFMRLGANDLVTCDGEDWHVRLVARMSACCTEANLGLNTGAYLRQFGMLQAQVNRFMRYVPARKMPQLGDMWTLYTPDVSRHVFLGFCWTELTGDDRPLQVLVETILGEREVKDNVWLNATFDRAVVTRYCGPASRRTYSVHSERFVELTASYNYNYRTKLIIRLDAFHMGRLGSTEGRMLEGTIVYPPEQAGECFQQDLQTKCNPTEFQRLDLPSAWFLRREMDFRNGLKVLDALEDLAVQPFGPYSATQLAVRAIALESMMVVLYKPTCTVTRVGICTGHTPRGILVRMVGVAWLIRYEDVRQVVTQVHGDEVMVHITL